MQIISHNYHFLKKILMSACEKLLKEIKPFTRFLPLFIYFFYFLFLNLFIYHCVGSSFLCEGFL